MRLIDADALKQRVGGYNPVKYTYEYGDVITVEDIDSAPTAQPERKIGRWEKVYGEHIYAGLRPWTVCCSECGMIGGGTRYCPNCGADMRTPTKVQLDEADDVMMMGGDNGETD